MRARPGTHNWELTGGKHLWTEISANIKMELEQVNDVYRKGQEWVCKFDTARRAIFSACDDLGMDHQVVTWAIHSYAEGNTIAHGDL
jgi:hypothetical protein